MVAAIIVTSLGSAHPPDAGQLVSHIPLPTDAKIICRSPRSVVASDIFGRAPISRHERPDDAPPTKK
jgi:hypothetical protein